MRFDFGEAKFDRSHGAAADWCAGEIRD